MANFYSDNSDLQFHIKKAIDWNTLVSTAEDGYTQKDGHANLQDALAFFEEVLVLMGEFVANEIAPVAATVDHHGPRLQNGEVVHPPEFDAIFEKIKALEIHGLGVPRELGGMNAPHVLVMVICEMFARADVSMMTHHSFHYGIAMALLVYSMSEGSTVFENGAIKSTRFENEIREMLSGSTWGAMDITEPDAGSDMAALRTVAEKDADGQWWVTGQKIFITSGHAKYHIVIAKSEGVDTGLEGLSTFMVKAYDDLPDGTRKRYAIIDRLEEKLGHHASPTCSISFEKAPAELIGNRGEGFLQMLLLMNNARIGVGFEGVAICEASVRLARDYAAERRAFGKTIDRHEMIADYLDEMETTTRAVRAMGFHAAFHEEMAFRLKIQALKNPKMADFDRKKLDREIALHKAESRRVTPLFKYLSSESAVAFARQCVQIHGGVGYTREYGAEKLLRDAMVMPIYEGTSQIQSLMAMKDTIGAIIKAPQEFLRKLAQAKWQSVSARDPLARRVAKIEVMSLTAQQHLIQKTAMDKFKHVRDRPMTNWVELLKTDWDPKRDFAFAMLHAERLTRILCDEVIVGILYDHAKTYPERLPLLEAYLERAEPRCRHQLDEIQNTGERMLKKLADQAQAAAE